MLQTRAGIVVRCLMAAAVMAIVDGQVARGEGPLTIEAVTTALEKQRQRIDSLQIETKEFFGFAGGRVDATRVREAHFAFEGGKRYGRMVVSTEMKTPGSDPAQGRRITFNDEQGNDGENCWERRVDLKRGPAQVFVFPQTAEFQWIRNPEYLRRIGWDCKTEAFTQDETLLKEHREFDMLSLMKKGAYAIVEQVAELDAARCIVIQRKFKTTIVPEDETTKPPVLPAVDTIWLDLEHGLAVRRRDEQIAGRLFSRLVTSDLAEIAPGIWFPKKLETLAYPPPDAKPQPEEKPVRSDRIDLVRWSVNDVPSHRFRVVTKPTDILLDIRKPDELRVIEDPADSEAPDPARRETASPPLTKDAENLVGRLVAAATSTKRDGPHILVALVAIPDGDPAEVFLNLLEASPRCQCKIVTPDDIRAGALDSCDAVLFPGGQATQQGAALGKEGLQAVRQFVERGGGYVGVCAGGKLATVGPDWSLGLINAKTLSGRTDSPGPDGVMSVDLEVRGSGPVKMQLTDAGRRIFGDETGLVDTEFAEGPVFLPAAKAELPEFVCLAQYRSELWLHKLQRGTMIDSPNVLAAGFGKGHVIIFSSHPEASPGTVTMLRQAVFAAAKKSEP